MRPERAMLVIVASSECLFCLFKRDKYAWKRLSCKENGFRSFGRRSWMGLLSGYADLAPKVVVIAAWKICCAVMMRSKKAPWVTRGVAPLALIRTRCVECPGGILIFAWRRSKSANTSESTGDRVYLISQRVSTQIGRAHV